MSWNVMFVAIGLVVKLWQSYKLEYIGVWNDKREFKLQEL